MSGSRHSRHHHSRHAQAQSWGYAGSYSSVYRFLLQLDAVQLPEVQRTYAECAEGDGFRIDACPPRDPQKRGIVDSGVKYIKLAFLPLREIRGIAEANRQLQE